MIRTTKPKRTSVEFPPIVVAALIKAAQHRGISVQSLLKLWTYDSLQKSGYVL